MMSIHLTPTELAREMGMHRRQVIGRCMDLGVPIFEGRIDKELFKAALAESKQRMSDAEFLSHLGTDAQRWAREFIDIISDESMVEADPTDEGFMIGWFANAIENGKIAGRQEALRDAAPDHVGPDY
jgi:hypothetical protein